MSYRNGHASHAKQQADNHKNENDLCGTLDGGFEELHAAGCIQTGADVHSDVHDAMQAVGVRFFALMAHTVRNPCLGCPIANRRLPGKSGPLSVACTAFQRYHTSAQSVRSHTQASIEEATTVGIKNGSAWKDVPIRKIAKTLGISLSEARRRKAEGNLVPP